VWSEGFQRARFVARTGETKQRLIQEQRERAEQALEHAKHVEARRSLLIKYFSERVTPGVHDVAAKKEGFGVWNEQFMRARFVARQGETRQRTIEEQLRMQERAREHQLAREEMQREHEQHVEHRRGMLIKYFSERVAPGVHDVAAKKEVFGVWNEQFMHVRFEREVKKRAMEAELEQHLAREEQVLEHNKHIEHRRGMLIKYFSERVAPGVHDVAAKKEALGVWSEQLMHFRFENEAKERALEHERLREEQALEQQLAREEQALEHDKHIEHRRGMLIKYFSEKVSPGVYDVAAKKEGFGVWNEQFMHVRFEREAKERAAESERAREEQLGEHQLAWEEQVLEYHEHVEHRRGMLIKYFSDRVAPGVHDVAAKKEGFGVWNEQFMHFRFEIAAKERALEHERARQEQALEHEKHIESRKNLLIKYFSERVAPGVHDVAAKKEAFGVWNEQFMHWRFERATKERAMEHELEQKRARQAQALEHEKHIENRRNLLIKYFSERVAPGVHDVAAKKEAFGVWNKEFMHSRFLASQDKTLLETQEAHKLMILEEQRARQELALEHQKHTESRKQMIIKYFSERVAPGVHDVAMKKEAVGVWSEGFMHERFLRKQKMFREEQEELLRKAREEDRKEKQIRLKAKGATLVKYFSEKFNPLVHDAASMREAFAFWQGYFVKKSERRVLLEKEQKIEEEQKRKWADFAEDQKKKFMAMEGELRSKIRSNLMAMEGELSNSNLNPF
jgi:hypothetical protein